MGEIRGPVGPSDCRLLSGDCMGDEEILARLDRPGRRTCTYSYAAVTARAAAAIVAARSSLLAVESATNAAIAT
jgi:hypothetical protein